MAVIRTDFNPFTVTHGGTPNVCIVTTLAAGTDRIRVTAKGGDTRYALGIDEAADLGSDFGVIPDGQSVVIDISDKRKYGSPPALCLACDTAAGTSHINPHRRHRNGR